MEYSLGRYVYGWAAIGFGICALIWHDFPNSQQIHAHGSASPVAILPYAVGAIAIIGGIAIQVPGLAPSGAVVLGAMFLSFALLGIPLIIAHPLVYNGYGNFFEQISFVSGAAILYASFPSTSRDRSARLVRIGYYAFGICVISFMLEQLFYLPATASFVPKWIPPGQMFWAIATTGAFAFAGVALLTGIAARPAALLTAAMIAGFGLLVWLPALAADSHSFNNWSETIETFGIAGTAWIVAGFLAQYRIAKEPASDSYPRV